MISAKEALDLYNNSLRTLSQYLETNFHSKIRQAAMDGKREYILFLDSCSEFNAPKLDELQLKVIAELQKLGFNASYISYGDSYVPRGLMDDSGNGPEYRNYGIKVTW